MSKTIRRVFKITILPASLLIISKALGVYFSTLIFKILAFLDTKISGISSIQIYFLNEEATILANSFSNIFVLTIFTISMTYLLIKYWLCITSTENTQTLVKLNELNLLHWVTDKRNTFLNLLIWIIFFWMINILIISDTIQNNSYLWISIVSSVITIGFTWKLIKILGLEIKQFYSINRNTQIC